jgi:hypothetical protein
MEIANWFPNEEAATERGVRVLNELRNGSGDVIGREIGQNVVVAGIASGEARWGFGYDFRCEDVFVRVHGSPKVSLQLEHAAVGCHVCVLGKIVNAYVENRVLVLSVRPEDYLITGTT